MLGKDRWMLGKGGIRLSVFLRSAKKSFVSLPGVVSFSTALLYCYRTGSITIDLSLFYLNADSADLLT